MSVLVEAVTVIVSRAVIDERFPGGTRAYLRAATEPLLAARYACADEHLTAVSFADLERATEFVDTLLPEDLEETEDDESSAEVCYVDERLGPAFPYRWLACARSREGYTHCWPAAVAPGALAVPEEWTPPAPTGPHPGWTTGEDGTMMRLAVEGSVEYWLDFETGRQHARPPLLASPLDLMATFRKRSLQETVEAAVRDLEVTCTECGPGLLSLQMRGRWADYPTFIAVDSARAQVTCYCLLPVRVPAERRAAAAELLMRASYKHPCGAFELDFDDGEVRYKAGIDLANATLSPHMLQNLVTACCESCHMVHRPLVSVAFGGVAPVEVSKEF